MIPLSDILRRHYPAYEKKFGARMLPSHKRAVQAILSCRTPAAGTQLYGCDCGKRVLVYNSCNHRSCPRCGHHDASQWLERKRQQLLPVPYFLVTATSPEQLRLFFRAHQQLLYALFLQEWARAIIDVARKHKDLGADIGLLAVLQTWARDLHYHVHIHCIVPGGGLSTDGLRWIQCKHDYFLPEKALALRLRTRFKAALQQADPKLFVQIPRKVWKINWVVDVLPVGRGEAALKYLGAYVYRSAFSSEKIIADDGKNITFAYRDNKGVQRTLRLPAEKFLHRVLQHVLPRGFQHVRSYGWLSPAAKARFERIRALLDCKAPPLQILPRPAPECPCCHKPMFLVQVLPRPPPG